MSRNWELGGLWTLEGPGDLRLEAEVPGCVHGSLFKAGLIPDPFYRDNERSLQWIGRSNWTYRRTFQVEEAFPAGDLTLVCERLDTLAEIFLNGHSLGRADNMFRCWRFPLGNTLCSGENSIAVVFSAPVPAAAPVDGRRRLSLNPHSWYDRVETGRLRKAACHFGWDWGPVLPTVGIGAAPRLEADGPRLREVAVSQRHQSSGAVAIRLGVKAASVDPPAKISAALHLDGREVAGAETASGPGGAELELTLDAPRLWWPRGMGEQPLYDLLVELRDSGNRLLDTRRKRIGLRTLRLERIPDEAGESFRFAANGVPFFARGANWIPADSLYSRLASADYRRLLEDAAAARMNMLRVWGGGVYEDDEFYDLCDELGLCVWQDFMFSCATYPTDDADFMDNARHEAREQVRRLRHHACLALWCGNNELEQSWVGDEWSADGRVMSWEDYRRLFDVLLAETVRTESPQHDYWPSSAHTPLGDRTDWNSPGSGDAHLWSVWHGREPMNWYRSAEHRFVSEFGFQSFPEPRSIAEFTLPQDRNLSSYIMEHHQRNGRGNATIVHYLLEQFRMPEGFDSMCRLSQILQGRIIEYAVEHFRRQSPACMGALYWQLNDCWPVASWSSIDYYGRWKALHYMARRFYAPVLVTAVEDGERGLVTIYCSSDCRRAAPGVVRWTAFSPDGSVLLDDCRHHTARPQTVDKVAEVSVSSLLKNHGARNLVLRLGWESDGARDDRLVLFAPPKHIDFRDPGFEVSLRPRSGGGAHVTIAAQRPAPWTSVAVREADVRCSDNFFHVFPGYAHNIELETSPPLSVEEIGSRLTVLSLRDTYRALSRS